MTEQKLKQAAESLGANAQLLSKSNEMFSFEVRVREDIKVVEHNFFKHIMNMYEERIKEFKHVLLLLERDVQGL
jgi:hypothetical protein